MKTLIATSGHQSYTGNYLNCLCWASNVIGNIPDTDSVVKIHRWRPGQKSLAVIAEVSSDGIQVFKKGRIVPLHAFLKVFDG